MADNPYLDFAGELASDKKSELDQSVFAAQDQGPDEKAKAMGLADKLQAPLSLVEKDPKSFEQFDYKKQAEETFKNYPKTAEWASDPNHAALIKDDLGPISNIENSVNEYTILDKSIRTLNRGAANVVSWIFRLPALINKAGLLPINAARSLLNYPELKTPDWLINNPVSTYYDEVANQYAIPEVGGSIGQELTSGNFSKAGAIAWYKFLENVPNLATLLVSGGTLGATRAAIGAGALSSAQQIPVAEKANVGEMRSTIDVIANGVYEAAFERLGTLSVFKESAKQIAKKYGESVMKEYILGFSKTLLKSSASEGAEEFATQIAQDLNDYVTGVNPDALKTLIANGVEAGLVGATSGAALTGPSAITTGMVQGRLAQKANSAKDFYNALGASVEATKLRTRLPQKAQELISHIVKDTSVQNIYISPEVVDTYFQSKQIPPVEAAQALGFLKEYNEAKISGADVKVPLGVWANNVVPTEHYAALQDDIKFSPEDLSVNEAAHARREIEQQALVQPTEEDLGGEAIRRDVESQLLAAGVPAEQAKMQSEVMRGFENIAARAGMKPFDFYKQFGLQISRQEDQGINGPEDHVLEQGAKFDGSNVIQAASLFTQRRNIEKLREEFKPNPPAEIKLKKGVEVSEAGRSHIQRFLARFGDAFVKDKNKKAAQNAVLKAQDPSAGPYVVDKKIAGTGFTPNYAANPTGVIGEPRIQNSVKLNEAPDPFAWLDSKWQASKELIVKHIKSGIPLTINTSSDLIGTDDYSESLPRGTIINMYLLTKNESLNRIAFPSNPSRARQEEAIKKLELEGFKVNAIEPTVDQIIEAAGGAQKLSQELGVEEGGIHRLIASYIPGTAESKIRLIRFEQGPVDHKALENKFIEYAKSDQAILDYASLPETEGGRYINQDYARLLMQEYAAGREGAMKHIEDTQKGSEILVQRLFEARLETSVLGDAGFIIGGPGSGKTTAGKTKLKELSKISDVVLDGVGGSSKRLIDNIDKAVASGRISHVVFVFSPLEKAVAGVIERFAREGRPVPAEVMARGHVKSIETYLKLLKKYAGNKMVGISAVESVGQYPDLSIEYLTPSQVEKFRYIKGDETAKEAIKRILPGIEKAFEGIVAETTSAREAQRIDSESGSGQISSATGLEVPSLKQGEPPRAQIRIGPNRTISIDLLKNMDRSSFLHEMGHAYLEVLSDAVKLPEASEDLKADFQTIRDWVGAKEGEAFTTEQHETFARGFEAYLMEGKAPSNALRKAFAAFKIWLTNIYKSLKSLNVELTPEVRGVFDRILASEEEINNAHKEMNRSFFGADPTVHGMSAEQSAKYLAAVAEADAAFKADLEAKLMKDLTIKQKKEYIAREKILREEATFEIENQRVYKAIDRLQSNEDIEGAQALKLDRSLVDPEIAKLMPSGVFDSKIGLPPVIVAEALGYDDALQMLNEISSAMPKKEAIDQAVNQKIEAEFPELLNSPEVPKEAIDSIHTEERAKVLRMQLEHLASNNLPVLKGVAKRLIKRVPKDSDVKQQAAEILGAKILKDVRPYLYERAERKMAKEAADLFAKGDIDGAFEAKRKEYLNYELFRAASAGETYIQKALQSFKKLNRSDEDLAQTRDMNIVNAARAVLSLAGLSQSEKLPDEYLQAIKAYDDGDQYASVSALVQAVKPKPAQEMNLNEFVDLKNAFDALWSISKENRTMEIDGQKIMREQAIAELTSDLQKTGPAKPKLNRAKTESEKFKDTLQSIGSMLRRVEHWTEAMGPSFKKYIFQPVSEGITRFRVEKLKINKQILEILKPIEKSITSTPIQAPELNGYTFSGMAELLGALIHRGNESNFSKLLRGRGWGDYDGFGKLNTSAFDSMVNRLVNEGVLTKEHFDAVQNIWNLFESVKPEAQKAHKAMYGFYFNEITADAFQTPFGEYKGGYAPAFIDKEESDRQNIRIEKETIEKNDNSFMFPTTGRGFTKSRVDALAEPLLMDLRLISMHLDKVMRFIHIEPRVKDVGRLLWNRSFRDTLNASDPNAISEMLIPWLQRSAQQMIDIPSKGKGPRGLDSWAKYLRKQAGMQIMVANVVNTLQNVTGFSLAALKVNHKYLRNSLWQYMKNSKQMTEDITSKSAFMATRSSTQMFDIQKRTNEILLNPSKYVKMIEFAQEHGYVFQAMTQNVLDRVVWSAAYDQAIEADQSEVEAVRAADAAVRQTQGSFNPEDISRAETGPAWARVFTMFSSYFNMQANLNATEFLKNQRQSGLKRGAGRALFIYTFGFMVPAVLSELIVRGVKGKLDENDDDEYLDDVLSIFFLSQLRTGFAMLPGVGQVLNYPLSLMNDKRYDDRITASPAINLLESAGRGLVSPYSIYENGVKKQNIRDALSLLGLLTGLPVAPLGKPLGYLYDVSQGEAEPQDIIDVTRGLVTGKQE